MLHEQYYGYFRRRGLVPRLDSIGENRLSGARSHAVFYGALGPCIFVHLRHGNVSFVNVHGGLDQDIIRAVVISTRKACSSCILLTSRERHSFDHVLQHRNATLARCRGRCYQTRLKRLERLHWCAWVSSDGRWRTWRTQAARVQTSSRVTMCSKSLSV